MGLASTCARREFSVTNRPRWQSPKRPTIVPIGRPTMAFAPTTCAPPPGLSRAPGVVQAIGCARPGGAAPRLRKLFAISRLR